MVLVVHPSTTIIFDIDARGHESTNEVSRLQISRYQTQDSRITRCSTRASQSLPSQAPPDEGAVRSDCLRPRFVEIPYGERAANDVGHGGVLGGCGGEDVHFKEGGINNGEIANGRGLVERNYSC